MASGSSNNSMVAPPRVLHFNLIEGMQLKINISGCLEKQHVRIEFQLLNCTRTWILHWGLLFHANKNWFIPADNSSGAKSYKHGALQSQFTKHGQIYMLIIELRDPNIHAIEFVLKDGSRDRWLKLNHGNFRIEIPASDPPLISHSDFSIPKELIESKAYSLWESKGRPKSTPQQQKQHYEDALRELQNQLSKGLALNELRNSYPTEGVKPVTDNNDQLRSSMLYSSYQRRYNVEEWLQKHSEEHAKRTNLSTTALINLIENTIGGKDVIPRQMFNVNNYEIVVFSKIINGDSHIYIAANTKGTTVLHWGVSKLSPSEWLVPPQEIWPENSKLVSGACQSYFRDKFTENGSFQVVDVNLQKRNFAGIQFVIWTSGLWIKNNGANFFADFKLTSPTEKFNIDAKEVVSWLLDEISRREKEAERSLMHRFNIATELTEHCKTEGKLGLIGILVWFRFMACRHLTWNKNYNVKPREISEALDRFTKLLQVIYLNQPSDREIVRLIMMCVGRGGQGDVGQRIRDEILMIQRNNDCKTAMMEEWHQKLHNNSSPDDVIICEALLNYVRCSFSIDAYWKTLNANGLTREKIASYDRPIVSEPHFRTDMRDRLIHDLTSYLKILKAVHSGVDLEYSIDVCLGSSFKDGSVTNAIKYSSTAGLPLKLLENLNFVKAHFGDTNIGPLLELLESRIELRPILLTSHGRLKDLLFLDISLDSAVRTTMERELKAVNFANPQEVLFLFSLILANICLSTVNNEDFIYCTKDWHRICESYTSGDSQWALQTKAILDRLQLVLAERSHHYQKNIQPSAEYLGNLLGVPKWAIDNFTEELIRSGCSAILSILINHFDPILRKVANLGCWQVISAVEVSGFVTFVNELMTAQNKVYGRPTIIITSKITGDEEIPERVVAVLTTDMPDVLSHIAIRARNNKICFATCFDQNVFRDLKSKEGKAISIRLKSNNLVVSEIKSPTPSRSSIFSFFMYPRVTLKRKSFCGKYAASLEEFGGEMVGAKSCNIKILHSRLPSWIKIPMSVALTFGSFEAALKDKVNQDVANKIASLCKSVRYGDLSKLKAVQEGIMEMNVPPYMIYELEQKFRSSRLPWPSDEGNEKWNLAWQSIKKVWASKWNERAFLSCQKAKLNHENICMSVLIQEVICADYAFVIHTKNPLSGDTSEIYAEIVKGLGETLVGAYPGRAMTFIVKKTNLKSHMITSYPSKLIGLYSKKSIIFRSDSNSEDLEGFAGAGLFDSVIMDKVDKVVLDYSKDPIITDKAFQTSLLSRIAEVGKIIEDLYGFPQDIEGVVKDGTIFVVQVPEQFVEIQIDT
ncbi:PREDICTED: alpha-glucan water dikinase 2 isoform X2 [Lupinus angustifolius]|uniref:alpha-glucan water dikinase 2 isoform X2 n=1 Tax=Lupinus angustifolius TaxID=3871 RepID=UPI00092EE8A8|nr:PREDICTED: alpha-glucan water dikinase 2 isoform X2 [Lupinus angustifolius]